MEETKEEFFISDDVEPLEIGSETDFLLPTVDHLYNRQSFLKSKVLAIPKKTADFIAFDESGVINLNESFWSLNRFNRNFDLNGNDVDCSEEIHRNRSSNFNDSLMINDDKRPLKSTASALDDSKIVNKNKGRRECLKEVKSDVEIEDEKMPPNGSDLSNVFSASKEIHRQNYDGDDNFGLWHSGPSHFFMDQNSGASSHHEDLPATLISSLKLKDESFDNGSQSARTYSHQQLEVKVEMVYNLLSMLGTNNREDMSKTFLAMSSSVESCHAMRQSGCIPLLVQLIHSPELDWEVKDRASKALHNIVHAQSDDKRRRREIRVLKLLEHVRDYCEVLRSKFIKKNDEATVDSNEHPVAATGALMKFSFDAEHRQAICTLGGLQTISELLQVDQEAHGCPGNNEDCLTLRRYACMSLTNLTFGDGKNKALLCGSHKFISALVDQLKSPSEDLRQVTASVLRNLSWRADSESKDMLRGSGAITSLTIAAMEAKKESTLKSMLSALWNLSAHCSINKVDICCVPGALAFLVKMLRYKSTSNTLAIVENAGGIIRNVSSHIAVREDYRQILRDNNCFEILLEQLRSSSLTIVSNACGTLWNLSARCVKDQRKLWEMGAANMLRNLVQSKHKMISMGSSAALKNLLSANPNGNLNGPVDATARSLGYDNLPTLTVRKQRALEQEINITLAETCDDVESIALSYQTDKIQNSADNSKIFDCVRSDSRESLRSSKSDSVYERLNQKIDQDRTTERNAVMHESLNERQRPQKVQDQKLMKRYRSSMIPTPVLPKHLNEEKSSSKALFGSEDAKTENPRDEKGKFKRGIPVFKARIKNSTFTGSEGGFDYALTNKSRSDVDFKPSVTSNKENNFEVAQSKLISPREECCSFGEFPREILIKDEKEQLCLETSIDSFCGSHPYVDISDPVANDTGDAEFLSSPTGKIASFQDSRKEIMAKKSYEKGEEKDSLRSDNLTSKVITSDDPSNISYDFGIHESPVFHFQEPQLSVARGSDEKFWKCVNTSGSEDVSVNDSEVVPNFKIGSEISDTKCFQSEANKICQAIRKCQDMDSTSQISVVSCSSFLDTADYSLFDFTHESTDFENWDDNLRNKNVDLAGYTSTKYVASNLNDNVTLPSLGSSKIEPIDAFDLESSIISVASIVSEIAESNSNTQDSECTSTLLNKTCEGGTNVKVEDPRVLDDSNDCTDEDNSLVSQENLPWDPKTIEEASPIEARRKMTPKEKRKLVSDRYRTYTIRDFRTSHPQERAPEHTPETEDREDILTNSHKSTEHGHLGSFNTCNLPACEGMNVVGQYCKDSNVILKPSHNVEGNETTVGSKSLTDLSKIGPFERKELVDNARMVALSFKTAGLGIDLDANVTIDSEGEYSQRSLEIDTTTYSKDRRKALLPLWDDHRRSQIGENKIEMIKPVISKAAEGQRKIDKTSEESTMQGVRGKRKPLYSSGMKNVRGDSTPASPKISQIKSSVEAKKYKLTTTKSLPNVPKSVFLLEREATFTKKQSVAPSKTLSVTETVLHPKNAQSKLSTHQKSINRIQTNSVEGGKLGSRRSLSAAGRNSSSPDEFAAARANQTIPKPSLPSSNANPKEKSRKEVESKIAKLWKMAEEAKEKNKNTKDRRVWIAPEKNFNCIDKTFEPHKRGGEVFEMCSGTSNTSEGTSSR